ncbi:B-cell receptor CD22-like [Eleutherodactylus coqui]|uniref:B-cell receptor CD22-like n=1 Tax=Eleutherodactylus coqui TaxID=57060 RepID=UPI003462E830
MLLFKGVYNIVDQVKLGSNVIAWKGSCVILPCEIISNADIHNYTWYHNSVYDDQEKNFEGAIVYQSKGNLEIDNSFKDRVKHRANTVKDCTILIRDLQSEHDGRYQIRLMGKEKGKNKDWKWMSSNMSLTVRDIAPDLKLDAASEMEENKRVTFTCSIDYSCPSNDLSLTWLHDVNGAAIKNETHKISITTTLTFVPTWKDNKKNISCLLYRMNEMEGNESIQLNVKYKPQNVTIIAKSPTISLLEGQNITLECSVESSNPPNPNIIWYKNGQKLDSEAYKKTVDESGQYHCEAQNSMGTSKSNTVEISVLHPPKHITIQKPQGNIKEGFPVTLNCSTVANPPVSHYTWYKNKMLVSNSTDSRYNFSKITENDSGFYECEASNSQGSNTSSLMYLDVKYAPRSVKVVIKPDNKQFHEGTMVTFECVVNSSNPNVTNIAWHKNDKLHKTVGSYEQAIRAEDAGTYTCEATNEIGNKFSDRVSIEVLYPPKNSKCTIVSGNIRKEQDQVSLQCTSDESNPKISSYEWFKSEEPYKNTTSKTLQLQKVQWTDSGIYTCKATSAIGSSKRATCLPLMIQYAPKNVTVRVSPGNSVTEYTDIKLICKGNANPNNDMVYTWYYKKEPLQQNRMEYTLANIQMSQAGEYYCDIRNSIGSNKSQVVYIHVSYSLYTIGMYTAGAVGSLIVLILIVVLILHFRICFRLRTCRKTNNDRSDSSFFVLKKTTNEQSDQLGQHTPSEDSFTEQINYASLQFPASTNGGQIPPRNKTSCPDPNDIYSVVKKPRSTAEYENVESSKITQDESQDEIHYSTIANLNKHTAAERGPEVEYAMLKH